MRCRTVDRSAGPEAEGGCIDGSDACQEAVSPSVWSVLIGDNIFDVFVDFVNRQNYLIVVDDVVIVMFHSVAVRRPCRRLMRM